ncbi:MAG: hypothetical protein ACI8PG_003266 [Planctomycetota bacterium]|jgi:hypothetical protein
MYKIVIALLLAVGVSPALAWWGDGHALLSKAAVEALPDEVPEFFRSNGAEIAAASIDADLHKNRSMSNLNKTEHSEHFIDIELLKGEKLPAQRYDFIALCQKLDVAPGRVGLVPYALAEWTGRLAVAFAEHRKWPDNKGIQAKCFVYAGFVAHYAQDLAQPLHTTVHFDGKKGTDGTVVGKGIHEKVDSVVERLAFTSAELAKGQELAVQDSLIGGIIVALHESHAGVEKVYAIGDGWDDTENKEMRALATARARAAVNLTASLYLTAWQKSDGMWLPGWLKR